MNHAYYFEEPPPDPAAALLSVPLLESPRPDEPVVGVVPIEEGGVGATALGCIVSVVPLCNSIGGDTFSAGMFAAAGGLPDALSCAIAGPIT